MRETTLDVGIPDLKSPATTTPAAAPSASAGVVVTDRAFERLAEIADDAGESKALRVAVLGGGCSGFSYEFALEDGAGDGDTVIERNGQRVLVDPESLPFLAGSVIDFKDELIGARFAVDNPNATSTCGCGTSFSI
ncbi:MAG: iron-sulfur cluster insertion protein ErpA [Pseudomonadota bacterium]